MLAPLLYARGTSLGEAAAIIALAVLVPFLTFTWLIGFATFQHHTHPRVLWYADVDEWNFYRSQVQGTVHVVFPRWIEVLLHNIMEHTAHHVDTKVPLYNLTDAQRQLEETFGDEVITEPFSFRGLRRTFASCCLYDFSMHQWLDFDGTPTTEPRRFTTNH
jgi:omega-6 fatty acid desaturase (delta-12 desaturase)